MSKVDTSQVVTAAIVLITVLFGIFELIIAGGFITVQQTNGFLSNLREGGANWYLNPIVWVLVLVVIVNFAGFVENYVILKQPYDIKKFAETWLKYLPMMIVFSQIAWANFIPNLPPDQIAATNIGITAALSFAIDIITRAIKSLSNNTSTTTTVTPAPVPTPTTPT